MSKRAIYISLLLFVFLLGLVAYLSGLGSYMKALYSITQLSDPAQKAIAEERFHLGGGNSGYSGTLAWIDRSGNLVWVWGKRGLKHYRVEDGTIYSHFEWCKYYDAEYIGEPTQSSQTETQIGRQVTDQIESWRARQGEYVKIVVANEVGVERDLTTAREIQSHDWQVYLPTTTIRQQCTN